MAGCNQEAAWLAQWRSEGKPPWMQQFIKAGLWSTKYMCIECGATGYIGGGPDAPPYGWAIACLIDHRTCDRCGVKTQSIGAHKECRLHHTTCCQHKDTNSGRLRRRLASAALVPA